MTALRGDTSSHQTTYTERLANNKKTVTRVTTETKPATTMKGLAQVPTVAELCREMFMHRRCYQTHCEVRKICVLVLLTLFGCAGPKIDSVLLDTSLQGAQQAIESASALEAERLPIEEFGRAVKLLALAQKAQENGDIAQSAEFAYQAELVARIAHAKARQHKAREQRVLVREQAAQARIAALADELAIARIQHELTKESLAEVEAANQQGKKREGILTTDMAELTASLQRTELQVTLSSAALLVNIAKELYPAIETTADYERAQATLALAGSLLAREDDFTAADKTTGEAQQQANALYETAVQNQNKEHAEETEARVAIAKAELIIERAQYLSASQHAQQPFEEATAHLKTAQQHFKARQYAQARHSAEASQQRADNAVGIAEVVEYRQRAQKELAALTEEAQRAVETAEKEIAAQANTDVPRLESRLYQLAKDALAAAKTALAEKDYPAAIQAAADSSETLQRAITNTQQLTSAKTNLMQALRKLPKVTEVVEVNEGVRLRISGNLFAIGSTALKPAFFPTFAQIAKVLRRAAFAEYPLRIEAHTATSGAGGVNMHISGERAKAVQTFLIEEGGLEKKRLTAVGLGETEPLGTAEELNRRIDITIRTTP